MTNETKVILTPNWVVAAFELQNLNQQGYVIDPDNIPVMNGFSYEIAMIKNPKKALENAQRIIDNAPLKMSRAECMAAARAAKKQGKPTTAEQDKMLKEDGNEG